jgi:hypothetical protein
LGCGKVERFNVEYGIRQKKNVKKNILFFLAIQIKNVVLLYQIKKQMKTQLSPQIDYSKMTEEEFFAFLDSEAQRIREENFIAPLSNFHKKYARVGTENQNQSSNKKK